MKCKNCAAELLYSADKTKLICPYCDTVIFLDPPKKSSNKPDPATPPPPAKRTVQLSGNMNNISAKGKVTLEIIRSYINDSNMVIDKYLEFFEARAKNDDCCAVPGINDNLLYKINQRLKYVMESDEEILFYRDNGIISRGKSGVLLTDSRVFVLEKDSTIFCHYKDISTFVTGVGVDTMMNSWLINNNAKANLNAYGCSDRQLGILISYLCKASFYVTDESQDNIINIKII